MIGTLALLLALHLGPNGRKLVFDQDYRLLKEKSLGEWTFNDGGVNNHELEKYTSQKAGNVLFTEEGLVIEARKKDGVITSARLESHQSFVHPFVEVVAKMTQKGPGTWPAIWMIGDSIRKPQGHGYIPWPDCGEIDIMENVGFDPQNFHFSLHSKNFNFMRHDQRTSQVQLPDPSGWHKFGLDCSASAVTFSVDGKQTYQVQKGTASHDSWPYDDPYYLILNLAIGGDWGGAKGVSDQIFPARLVIRSVKVYE